MEKDGKDYFKLSTGKRIYAYNHLLSMDDGFETLFNGYDGSDNIEDDFTKDEIIEICDYQIALWTKLKKTKRNFNEK
jgi:hypothetical protein